MAGAGTVARSPADLPGITSAAKSGEIPALSRNGGAALLPSAGDAAEPGRLARGRDVKSSRKGLLVRHTSVSLVLSASILLAACGGSATTADPGGDADTPAVAAASEQPDAAGADAAGVPLFPVSVTADNGEVTIPAAPVRIISLSPSATEILFAIGAGEQVIAVDDYSYYPPEAPVTDLSGYTPNTEAILAYQPDLLVIATDPGDLVASMEGAGVATIVQDAPADLDGVYAQFETLGVATGQAAGAAMAVAQIRTEVDGLTADLPDAAVGLTYFHELDPALYTATSQTFVGSLYALFGLVNIADAGSADGNPYPQLSEEFVVEASPDLVFFSDTYAVSAQDILARPGWQDVAAVRTASVFELDPDISSRWGPRLVGLLTTIREAVMAHAAAA